MYRFPTHEAPNPSTPRTHRYPHPRRVHIHVLHRQPITTPHPRHSAAQMPPFPPATTAGRFRTVSTHTAKSKRPPALHPISPTPLIGASLSWEGRFNFFRSVSAEIGPMSSPIHHIILFSIKDPADKPALIEKILSLKHTALKDGKPYIVDVVAGGSIPYRPGKDDGYNFGFVMVFKSEEDYNYYVNDDPVHGEFKALAGPRNQKTIVFNFKNGQDYAAG